MTMLEWMDAYGAKSAFLQSRALRDSVSPKVTGTTIYTT
jgi:hypothetical protein